MRFHRTLVVGLACTAALAACSSKSDPLAGRTNWDATATQQLEVLRQKVEKAFPGFCNKLLVNSFPGFAESAKTLKLQTIPLSMATCDFVNPESAEFALFKDAAERERSVNERTQKLCRIALHPKGDRLPVKGFPGLRFAVGANWSVQVDSQGRGRDIADILGGAYLGKPCENDVSDWEKQPLDDLMAKLKALPKADCPMPTVDDHDAVRIQQYKAKKLPVASVSCADEGSKVHLITFGSAIPDQPTYLATLGKYFCIPGFTNYTMMGDGWGGVVLDKTDALPKRIAAALGLNLTPLECNLAPRATTTTRALAP